MSQLVALSPKLEIEPSGEMQGLGFPPDKIRRIEAGLTGPTVAVIDVEALKSAFIDCCMNHGWISVDRETDSCCLTARGKTELAKLGLRKLT